MYFLFWEKQILQAFCHYFLFPEFLKININILLSFKFEKILVLENNIDINIMVQTIENDQYAHGVEALRKRL